jgi:hypothetical protein
MKKFILIISILIFSLVLAILFNPRSAEGAKTEILRLDAKDIKEVFYGRMSENISTILSDIRRDLTIEKDENLLLKKRRR